MNLSNIELKNNVYMMSLEANTFSANYLEVREKEQRILTDEQVVSLPFLLADNPNFKEWKLRQKSTNRIVKYIKKQQRNITILDIGCGNGWFSNKLAGINNVEVIGVDVNIVELEQASRIFKKENLQFIYGNIFMENAIFKNSFDIITLNATIQYFPDFNELMEELKTFLKPKGEIHIIDSPFYKKEKLPEAKQRTLDYYSKMGFPAMATYYFHHTFNDINTFKILYSPIKSKIRKIFTNNDSPFLWVRFKK